MSSFSLRKQDPVFFTGLGAIVFSMAVYLLAELLHGFRESGYGAFAGINFALSLGYLLLLMASRRLKKGQNGLFPFLIFLVLFSVSAYALNREIHLLEISATLFCVILVLFSGNYIAIGLVVKMPDRIRYATLCIAGVSIAAFVSLLIVSR